MLKLCLNARDELVIIDLEKIAFFQANGNYTHINYISGDSHLSTIGLSKIEQYIRASWPADRPSPFLRLGRSIIINQSFVSRISVLKQKLTLSDNDGHSYSLNVPKALLKQYKEHIYKLYTANNNG